MDADHRDVQRLRQLEERLLHPDIRRSADALSELLAEDFVEFGSSGRVFGRSEIIEALSDEPPIQRSLQDFRSRVLAPGVVLVTYRVVRRVAPDDPPVHVLHSSVWRLGDGQWQMVFHQGTRAAES